MLKKIALIVVVLLVALVGYASTLPDTFRIERSATIDASPDKIFPLVNDLRAQQTWSPWEKMDPDMTRELSPNMVGVGATYAWSGDMNVGAGVMEITGSVPNEKVVMALHMTKPMTADNTVELTLAPDGKGTRVTWAMFGPQPLLGKVMSVVMNCDKMVGQNFEDGLASLKALAEQGR